MADKIHNNKPQNWEWRDREKVTQSLKKDDSPLISGPQIIHNYIRPHMGLDGKTQPRPRESSSNGEQVTDGRSFRTRAITIPKNELRACKGLGLRGIMKRRRILMGAIICGLLFFALVPFVHGGAVGPYPYYTHPSNYVYESLSCRTVGLGTTFWDNHYGLGCGTLIS